MRRSHVALAAAALIASVSTVLGADYSTRRAAYSPPIAPYAVANWSGLYVGGHIGYASGDMEIDNLGVVPTYDFDVNGFVGGAQIGYNWQWNQFVFGLEA